MKFTESLAYRQASVEDVFALISDQGFRSESCAHQGATDFEVTVEETGDGATVTVVRDQEAEMPDVVKKFIGGSVKIKQTEVWSGPDATGNRTADIMVSIIGQPAEMTGTAALFAQGGDTAFELEGDVKVSIPFIGKKIEPEIAKAIKASMREEVAYGASRL